VQNSDLIRQLVDKAKEYPSITKIALFGSRARSDYSPTSDFDICVSCWDEKDYINFYFDVEDIDTFYTIDLLRYENLTNDLLKEEISRDEVTLYELAG